MTANRPTDPPQPTMTIPEANAFLPGEGGFWLHSHRLALTHPATGDRLELECPPPPQLRP